MQVSIIIVNFNTRDLLRNCLLTIYQETRDLDFEVIVIDNGSEDGSCDMLESDFGQVKLIRNPTNRGYTAAINQGIGYSRGQKILLLNSDTEILDGAIQKTLKFTQENPTARIVGCRLLNPDRTIQPSCRGFPSLLNCFSEAFFLYKIFPGSRAFGSYYMTNFDFNSTRAVDVVMGAFMLIEREVLTSVGLFDESFFMYAEETDFCMRAGKLGIQSYFYSDAEVIHKGSATARKYPESMFRLLYHTKLLLLKKHFSDWTFKLMLIMHYAGILLRIPIYFLGGILLLDRWTLSKSWFFLKLLGGSKSVQSKLAD